MIFDATRLVQASNQAHGFAGKARSLRPWLGGLSRWVLTPEAREACDIDAPALPDHAGAAHALFVWDRSLQPLLDAGLLAPAFALPLCWMAGTEDSPGLPGELAKQIAPSARASVAGAAGWGLHLDGCLGEFDLSALHVSADSAWAPLAAGLFLALHGGRPSGRVFATGAWNGRGVEGVDGIDHKIEAAVRIAGDRKGAIYVPAANYDEADKHARGRIEVESFAPGQAKPEESLSPLLSALAAPPPPGASLEERCNYANKPFVLMDRRGRQQFYRNHIVADLAGRLLKENPTELEHIDRLALGVSFQWELAVLVALALSPERCAFLCTPESEKRLGDIREKMGKPEDWGEVIVLRDRSEIDARDRLMRFLKEGTSRVVEITGGTKKMTAVLLVAGMRSGARTLYLRHEMMPGTQTQKYGTEKIEQLDWV